MRKVSGVNNQRLPDALVT